MNQLLAEILLAGPSVDGDDGGWMELLVLAVMAAIYGLGSIVRAKKHKPDADEQTRPPQRAAPPLRSAGTPPDKAAARQRRQPLRPAPQTRTRRAIHEQWAKIARGTAPAVKPSAPAPLAHRVLDPPLPQPASPLDVQLEQLGDFTTDAVQSVVAQPLAATTPKPPDIGHISDILPDISEPDNVRRAILYYEILGKAVSLRQPAEHLIEP